MAEGRLIIEVYEYSSENETMPRFEFIPCLLENCIGRSNNTALDEIVQRGFSNLPRRYQNTDKQKEILKKLGDAGFNKIGVSFHPADDMDDAYVELTNVSPVSMSYADARRSEDNSGIILSGRYSLSDNGTSMRLKDAQRLTIICSTRPKDDYYMGMAAQSDEPEKEICLNVTYLLQ